MDNITKLITFMFFLQFKALFKSVQIDISNIKICMECYYQYWNYLQKSNVSTFVDKKMHKLCKILKWIKKMARGILRPKWTN